MQERDEKINKMVTWIDNIEKWSVVANAAIQQAVQDQQKLVLRARHNNLHIQIVPEAVKGRLVREFIVKLLQTKVKPEDEIDWHVQHAHGALAPKLP